MQTISFMQPNGKMVAIVTSTITGVIEYKPQRTFVATGADSGDGGENGFYVLESFTKTLAKINLLK